MNSFISNIYTLLAVFAFASCTGQVKTDARNDSVSQDTSAAENHPMMVRTLGAKGGNLGCGLQDSDGNLWFSTGGEGVYRYDGESFTNFTTQDGLCSNDVGKMIQDREGNILMGTSSGICKYDGKGFSKYFETDTLNELKMMSLFEDRDGNLWFGAMARGLYRYDGTSVKNFLNHGDHAFNLGSDYQLILDILQDKSGKLWFSSWNGGGVWSYDGSTFKNFLPSKNYYQSNEDGRSIGGPQQGADGSVDQTPTYPSSQDNLTDDMIYSITEDKTGNLWFGTRRHGACRYDGKTFTSFREREGLVSYGVGPILEDQKGNLWFATDKNGVFCYDGKTFKNYTTDHGLVNNSVKSILEDKAGNLWFGTRWFGLSRFDGKTFTTFSEYKEG